MNRYVGVGWHKAARKWRAYVTVRGPRVRRGDTLRTGQIFRYVGLFSSPDVAAAARQLYIGQHPELSSAAQNVPPRDAYLALANFRRHPETSELTWLVPRLEEEWHPFPGLPDWQISDEGQTRTAVAGVGWATAIPNGGTVTLSTADGHLRRYKLSLVMTEVFSR